MPRKTTLAGWLQDVATNCTELQDGLYHGSIPDAASSDDDWELLAALEAAYTALDAYRARCFEAALDEAGGDRDPGPSQEQRL